MGRGSHQHNSSSAQVSRSGKTVQLSKLQAKALVQTLLIYENQSHCFNLETENPDFDLSILLKVSVEDAIRTQEEAFQQTAPTDFNNLVKDVAVPEEDLKDFLDAAVDFLYNEFQDHSGEPAPWTDSINGVKVDWHEIITSVLALRPDARDLFWPDF